MIGKIKAFSIAEKIIKEKQSQTKYDDFSETELTEETEYFWTFVSGSEKMYQNGIVPGAFFVHISKTNGQVLDKEQESFYRQKVPPQFA